MDGVGAAEGDEGIVAVVGVHLHLKQTSRQAVLSS